jgi:hypothetical protein
MLLLSISCKEGLSEMDSAGWIAVITSSVALLGMIFSLYVSIRKQPFDLRKLKIDADKESLDLVKTYKDMVDAEVKDKIELRNQIRSIREEQKDIVDELELLRQMIEDKNALIEEWRIGIERLIGQVVSLGHTPVWRPRSNVKVEKNDL